MVSLGENYWKLTEDGVASGYPRLISRAWPGLPGNIDAAFTYKNGKTYFFKGSKYWRYNGQKVDGQYPKEISEGTYNNNVYLTHVTRYKKNKNKRQSRRPLRSPAGLTCQPENK